MVRQQWYVHTMSEMCCYVYVCIIRQQWYVHTVSEMCFYVYVCMEDNTLQWYIRTMSATCFYAVCMHGKTTLVRTYYELNVLLCLSKTTMVCTYYI